MKIIIILCLAVALTACLPFNESPQSTKLTGFRYEIVEIGNMPCIVAGAGIDGRWVGSITCDWTKYQK